MSPQAIAEDKIFDNVTKVWINGDHYKWRAMRTLGVNEQFITGNGSDKDKFLNWAKTVPYTMRNPLYHWTHLELARYFDIYDLLNEKSANTQGNDLGHSNNEKDWIIRSQAPKYAIASIWRRFRDYNGMGLRKLATFEDSLRYSPIIV